MIASTQLFALIIVYECFDAWLALLEFDYVLKSDFGTYGDNCHSTMAV